MRLPEQFQRAADDRRCIPTEWPKRPAEPVKLK
jgi:hypothetical protein